MRNWLTSLQPNAWLTRKLVMLAILAGVSVAAFFLGRRQMVHADPLGVAATPGANIDDYERRVVAYMYDNKPVMRSELGEYLIARFGAERLEFLLNRKIVEIECAKLNIVVTDAEVDMRFRKDLASFGPQIDEKNFVNNILRRFGKTLYEWKEDVIRPKLMMEAYVKPKVQITDKDLHEGFEARYGPKVECRMIVIDPKAGPKVAMDVYSAASKGYKQFLEEARKQFIPNLAQTAGQVPPIHKHFGDKRLEEIAFSMNEGDVCPPLQMPDKTLVILLCEKHLKADTTKRFEDERMKLSGEMYELRLAQRIPEEFAKLREKAHVRPLITREEPRGTLPPVQPPYPTSQPTPRTDIAPLIPSPLKAPAGHTPLSDGVSPLPLPPVVIPTQPILLPPAASNIGPTEKK